MPYLPLHIYSGNSFLRSALPIRRIGGLAQKHKAVYLSICDYGTCSGFPEIQRMAKILNVPPVFGMDVEIDGNLLSLFVKSEEGYRNLLLVDRLFSEKNLTLAFLKEHSAGLEAVLSPQMSFVHSLYRTQAKEIPSMLSSFSRGFRSFRLGIPYLPEERSFVSFLRDFALHYPYPTLAFPHILYEKKEDAIVLKIVEAIAARKTLEEKEASGDQFYLPQQEGEAYFTEEENKASFALAESCSHFEFLQKRGGLLVFPNPLGICSEDYLRKIAFEGLSKKKPGFDDEYRERLEYELSIINKMGYADYFLLVQDYVNYARNVGILVGPGRGSGAGSLVSYALDIVTPDPIENGLLFERFLNPERQSMPDIDVDFADIRRDEVVAYLQKKYGKNRVSHILTEQTMMAKASIRDVGRVYSYEPRQIDLLAKSVDNFLTLRQNYKMNPRFRKVVDSDRYYLQIVSLAAKIEGLPRQSGLHAAGVILNDKPLEECLPISDQEGIGYVSQFEMTYLEEQDFLKMDLLGLRNLTIVQRCLEKIKMAHGVDLYYRDIPYRDKDAIALIASTKTMGLFQLESPGMNRAIRELHPESFDDVVALLALFRPGPMENIPSYARRKAGKEKVQYLDPCLEKILAPTYGIIVYQEQIMQMVQALAGFSFGQADSFRRAISKKDAAKLAALKSDFIRGCLQQGRSRGIAEKVFDLIYRFADYGFNKSHSVCYAMLACQMAYLKAHYPEEFYCTILDDGGMGQPALVSEIKASGLRFLVPDVNGSGLGFSSQGKDIRLPFTAIAGLQRNLVYAILDERSKNGAFEDYFSFVERLYKKGLNEASLLKLIDAGCFDSLCPNRASLRLSSKPALKFAEVASSFLDRPSLLPFSLEKPSLIQIEPQRMYDLLCERDCLGMMVSGSPLESKEDEIKKLGLLSLSALPEGPNEGRCAGIVSSVKAILAKSGKRMAFLKAYDEEAEAEFTLFSEAYDLSYPALKEGNLVSIAYQKDRRNPGKYLAAKVEVLP